MHSPNNRLRKREPRYVITAAVILVCLLVAAVLYVVYFGTQTMFVLESRYMARKVPILNMKPIELQDLTSSSVAGKKLSYFGYEFEVPWSDLDESATKIYPDHVLLTFGSGPRLRFVSAPPREFVNAILSSGKDPDSLRQLYGKEAFDSDYAFVHLMLNTTPEEITMRTPQRDVVGRSMMLTFKAIAVPSADTEMFSIHNQDFKGFQYGNPQSKPKRVVVDLYADDGGLEFVFYGKDNTLNISQPEINRVIQTARKTKSSNDSMTR